MTALEPLFDMALRTGNPTFVAAQLFYLQDALLERTGLDKLADHREDTGPGGRRPGRHMDGRDGAHRSRAAWAPPSWTPTLPCSDLRAALAIARGLSMGPAVAPLGSMLALALPREQADEANLLVAEELEAARATDLDRPQGLVLRAAGILAPDQEGVPLLRESIMLLDRCGARVERARSLLALGACCAARAPGSRPAPS